MSKSPQGTEGRQLSAWQLSPEFRVIALAALHRINTNREAFTLCGARKKSSGELCRNFPVPGRTRCKFHGGATPRGDGPIGWHTPGFPLGHGLPTGKARSEAQKRRRAIATIERLEDLTPEQRARYEAWKATHTPGSAAKRLRRRTDRDASQWLQKLMAGTVDERKPRRKPKRTVTLSLEQAMREGIGVFR